MPHICLKMYKGRDEKTKNKIAHELAAVLEYNGIKKSSISVCVVDIESENWKEEVYDKEIKQNKDIIIMPEYEM